MLDEYKKHFSNGSEFKEKSGVFNVNMNQNLRTLHCNHDKVGPGKTDEVHSPDGSVLPYKKCPRYDCIGDVITFDSWSDVLAFEAKHSVRFRRCGNCFPEDMR